MGNQGWEKVSTESWASTEYLAMPNLEPLALEGRTHHRASSHRDQRQLICPQLSYPSKVHLVKAMVVMYGCESWTIKKAECWRIDALELWCWRRLLRVPWTARRSNQSILKETSPEYWNVPDILECEVKWALWSITMNKTSGGDGIPVEWFQILRDILWKCWTQYASKFGKFSSGHRTGKCLFSFISQRKAMPKNAQTTSQLHSSHTLAK